MTAEQIAGNVKQYFTDKGIKQSVIARKIGVSEPLFSEYLNGKTKMPLIVYFKLCDELDVSTEIFRKGATNDALQS